MLSASLPPLLDAGYEIGVIFHQRSRCSVNPAKKISSPDLLGKNKILHLVVSGSFFAGLQFKDESSRGGDGIRAWIGRLPPAPLQASHSAGVKSRTLLTQAQGTFITVAALTRDYMAPHFSVLIMLSQHSCSLTYTLPKGSQRVGRVLGRFTLTIHTKESALALPPSPATILRIVSHLTLTFKGRCYESHFIGFRSEVYSLAFIFSLR